MRIWIISPHTFYGLGPVWIVASGSHTKILALTSCMGWRLDWSPLFSSTPKFWSLAHILRLYAGQIWASDSFANIFGVPPNWRGGPGLQPNRPLEFGMPFFVFTLLLANIVK
jgi:hypothetical protein